MPSDCVALSREYIACAAASASACACSAVSSGVGGVAISAMKCSPAGGEALNQGRNPIAVFAIGKTELGQHAGHVGNADGIGPGQWPAWIVDTFFHRHVGV